MKSTFKFIFALLLFMSFNSSTAQIQKIEARLIKSINEFDNGEIIADVRDIVTDEEFLYFLDGRLNKVFVTKSDLKFVRSFGKKGPGPEELSQPMQLLIAEDDKILIFDLGKKILPFNRLNGKVEESFPLKPMITNHNMILVKSTLYFSEFTNPLETFGQYNLVSNQKGAEIGLRSNPVTLGSHILTDGERIYSINGENKPEIKTFDFDGSLKQSQDLSSLSIFSEPPADGSQGGLKTSGNGNIRKSTSGRIVVQDAHLVNRKLYLLIPQKDKKADGKTFFDNIYVFEKVGTEWKPTEQIQLSEKGTYMTFRIYDKGKKLVTFDIVNGNIETFDIDKL